MTRTLTTTAAADWIDLSNSAPSTITQGIPLQQRNHNVTLVIQGAVVTGASETTIAIYGLYDEEWYLLPGIPATANLDEGNSAYQLTNTVGWQRLYVKTADAMTEGTYNLLLDPRI